MLSPSCSRITKRIRSSITELSFHGIPLPPPSRRKSVTHVSGTFCYLSLRPLIVFSPETGSTPTTGALPRTRPIQRVLVLLSRNRRLSLGAPQGKDAVNVNQNGAWRIPSFNPTRGENVFGAQSAVDRKIQGLHQ